MIDPRLPTFLYVLFGCLFATAAEPRFLLYAPHRAGNEVISVIGSVDENDTLTLSVSEKLSVSFPAMGIVAHPHRSRLYITTEQRTNAPSPLLELELDENGRVTSSSPGQLQHGSAYTSFDRSGRFFFTVSYHNGWIDVYRVDKSGVIGARVCGVNQQREKAHSILTSTDNRFAYVPYVKDSNALHQYRFDAISGQLTALVPIDATPAANTGPRHLVFHPDKPIVYFSNEQQLGVSVYEIGGDGQLTRLQVLPSVDRDEITDGGTKKVTTSDILFHRDSKTVFIGVRDFEGPGDAIASYRVDADGRLQFIATTPCGDVPWKIAQSPDGEYLLVSEAKGKSLAAYRIGKDGSLKLESRLNWNAEVWDLIVLPTH